MFLDIQMPDLDGFGVLQALEPDQLPVTVFVTAYDKYAIQAFEAHALDYLLKPYSDQRFEARSSASASSSARATAARSTCASPTCSRSAPAWTRIPASSSGSC